MERRAVFQLYIQINGLDAFDSRADASPEEEQAVSQLKSESSELSPV